MHIFVVIQFPYPWPPSAGGEIISREHDSKTIFVAATQDGRLMVRVYEDENERASFLSQRLKIVGRGVSLLEVLWNNNKVEMHINENKVKAHDEADNTDLLLSIT